MKNKISVDNNWEADTYSVDGKRISDLSEVKIGAKKYKVRGVEISVRYMDMGTVGYGRSMHYFVTERVFGTKMEFDLNEIADQKTVYATKFTLAEK